jgi:hypothetical protein
MGGDVVMTKLRSEMSVIPKLAWIPAACLVVVAPVGMTALMQLHESHPPPVVFSVAFGLFIGGLLGLFVLAVGYVNGDAKRRGMNALLWTLLALFVPNALGLLLYFFMREPLRAPCPGCGLLVQPTFNYCPTCHHALRPICAACGKGLAPEHTFCPYCGQKPPAVA